MVAAITITPSPLFGRIGVRPEVRKGSEAAVGGRESADFCRAAPSRLTLGFDRPELGATGNDQGLHADERLAERSRRLRSDRRELKALDILPGDPPSGR